MAEKIIKCVYEHGCFKPLEEIHVGSIKNIRIMLVEKPHHRKELLREGYEATAAESRIISEEAFCIESEADTTAWEK